MVDQRLYFLFLREKTGIRKCIHTSFNVPGVMKLIVFFVLRVYLAWGAR